MTELTITPKIADKTARFKGAVAAGEHVAVTIKGGAAWLGDDNGAHLTLRVLDLVTGRTLAVFPRPPETLEEGDETDEWSTSTEDPNDLFCNLSLNTDRMVNAARHMLRVPVLFVMGAKDDDNPATTRTLYFRDRYEVEFWPERVGDDTPYDLDRWPKKIDEWTELVAEFDTRLTTAEANVTAAQNAAQAAEAVAVRLENDVAGHRVAAEAAAEAAAGSESSAAGSATEAAGARNDARDRAASAQTSAAAASGSATSARNSSLDAEAWAAGTKGGEAVPATDEQHENNAKYYAERASTTAGALVDAEKARAQAAESALSSAVTAAAGKVDTLIGGDANKSARTISAEEVAKVVASAPADFDTLKEIADWIAGDQNRTAAVVNRIAALEGGTFAGVPGKGLSTNDYTTAEKQKLVGIADGANAYVLPPATSSALGGVKQGTGCTIAPDGTLNVTGGGSGTVDDTVTRASGNPVKSSGIWSAIWGALTALPTGFTSLYEWVVEQLAGKASTADATLTRRDFTEWACSLQGVTLVWGDSWSSWGGVAGWVLNGDQTSCMPKGDLDSLFIEWTSDEQTFDTSGVTATRTAVQGYRLGSQTDKPLASEEEAVALRIGKANAADLRYRIAEAEYDQQNDIYILADRTVNTISTYNQTSIDIGLPDAVTVDGVRYARDFFLDIDNSQNASDLALEFTALGVSYAFVPLEDDSVSEMMTIGAGERVRLYFTETPYTANGSLPVINVARVTLGDFVTSTTTQGGN